MTILIVGGAGYVGSHVNKCLFDKGYESVVFDNLVQGHKELVKWGSLVVSDLLDVDSLRSVFGTHKIDSVMHFAAHSIVSDSVCNPEKYYYNNVVGTLNLLKVMREFGVDKIIFSSTCATYGTPTEIPITESHVQNPINPYGQSKLTVERMLNDFSLAYGLKCVSLRYFNAAGADPYGEIGEWHEPETHLIPLLLNIAIGDGKALKLFGTDYPTKDGTCVRDYIHVNDLAEAHVLALQSLLDGGSSDVYNLGNERGFSVSEVVEMVRKITKKDIKIINVGRREGDPPTLIGSSRKIREKLGWVTKYSDIKAIVETAWKWQQELRGRYK